MNPSHENHTSPPFDDHPDRLLDIALAEVFGGKSPPDLSAQIAAATTFRQTAVARPAPRTRATRAFWASLALAIMLLIGVTIVVVPQVRSAREQGAIAKTASVQDSKQIGAIPVGNGIANPIIAASTEADNEKLKRFKIAELVDSYNHLNHEQRFAEAETIAHRLNELAPNDTVAAQISQEAKLIRRDMMNRQLTGNNEEKVWTQLNAVEKSAVKPVAQSNGQAPPADRGVSGNGALPSPYFMTDDVQHHAPPKSALAAKLMRGDAVNGDAGFLAETSRRDSMYKADAVVQDDPSAPYPAAPIWEELSQRKKDRYGSQDLKSRYAISGPERPLSEDSVQLLGGHIGDGSTRLEKSTELGTGPGLPGDKYTRIVENPFVKAEGGAAVSTFSIDVDTASYSNVRQFLMETNQLPPPDAVRIEELVNYFNYDYAPPKAADEAPFAAHIEVAGCPWNAEHRLARIAVKGREMDRDKRPQSNLVFLVDVSGSMNEPAKLPLVVYGLQQLTKELGENDHIAIVVYAGTEGLALPSTSGSKQKEILAALGKLQAGGSTAGGAGIQLAYQIAEDNFIKGGTNRVILCTDGDFNVGTTSTADLQRLVEKKAKDTGVFLSTLGFGRGNLNDAMMVAISDHGNGNYHYVDNRTEARRVLVEQMTGTLVTIAKDVKIQVEFNPVKVSGYRLIGYEKRMLRTEDFNDDKKDAGEIGAGHTVTALYEIVPAGKKVEVAPVDDLKYQKNITVGANKNDSNAVSAGYAEAHPMSLELLTLKMRYKAPDGDTSKKLEWPITDDGKAFAAASGDLKFASAVASFGMLLRDSQYKGNLTYAAVLELAQSGIGEDPHGYRKEFLEMVRKAKELRHE